VRRALSKDPRQRWPSCRAFVEATREETLATTPPAASPETAPSEERHRQLLLKAQRKGEEKLTALLQEIYERSRGNPTREDQAAIGELIRRHALPPDRAQALINAFVERWRQGGRLRRERRPGELWTNHLRMAFAWCPPGTFVMGSPQTEADRIADERQRRVTLTRGFFLGVTPVTRVEFAQLVGAADYLTRIERAGGAPSWKSPGCDQTDEHPAVCVSWEDADALCAWLSTQGPRVGYTLPTEAEWEYACRAGTATPFWFGDAIDTDLANYNGTSAYGREGRKGVYRGGTTPVDSFPANPWGLRDMHGNVWEWCSDWFGEYAGDEVTDPTGPERGPGRVLRGGSWYRPPGYCRSASRNRDGPGFRMSTVGCRLVARLD
jgi:formylglycine-generating enzyme required for sulfatase activity